MWEDNPLVLDVSRWRGIPRRGAENYIRLFGVTISVTGANVEAVELFPTKVRDSAGEVKVHTSRGRGDAVATRANSRKCSSGKFRVLVEVHNEEGRALDVEILRRVREASVMLRRGL